MKVSHLLVMVGLASLAALAIGMGPSETPGEAKADSQEWKAVERAVLDYCEAFYEMKPEYLERSVHPNLHKFGYYRNAADQPYRKVYSDFDGLHDLAKVWNKDGHFGPDAKKTVEVFEVLDQIAVAKLIGDWGIDYVHLAKIKGKWMIVQVIWQSHPIVDAKPANKG